MPSPDALRIGIVQPDDPPRGGLGRALIALGEALRERGAAVHMLDRASVPRMSFRAGGKFLFPVASAPRFARDRKLTHLLVPVGPGGALLLPATPGVRRIAIVYHTYAQQARLVPGQGWKRLFVPQERRLLRSAERIFCSAPDTCAEVERSGIAPERIVLLPHVVDLDPWNVPVAKIPGLCICVSRLEKRKNVEAVLRAWPLVRALVPHARLTIVGDGIGRDAVYRAMRDAESVSWQPRCDLPALRTLVAGAEVALCPAYLEGFGLACVEAMAAGTAVVANDAEGLRSLVRDGETGILTRCDDSTAFADAIARLLRDSDLRSSLAEHARCDILTRFDRDAAVDAYLSALASS